MQYLKPRVGIAKNNSTTNKEKAFDLDRKRDDESIIDVQSLKDPDYQISKKQITFFDTQTINLLHKVVPTASSSKWNGEGEVHLTLRKSTENRLKYWTQLEETKSNNTFIWWEMKEMHQDAVDDLKMDEAKSSEL